jgi:hypothetical protein
MGNISVEGLSIIRGGRFLKVAKLRHEPYECLQNPEAALAKLKEEGFNTDAFTFLQEISDPVPKYQHRQEWHRLAVIPVSSYEHWFKNQINDKTRNMIRKPGKHGVVFRVVEFTDDFVRGVVSIYNETPTRQGTPFKHYGKDFETIKRDLATFFDQSEFVGAFANDELIGFVKLVRGKNVASLMHIISKIAHRNKAPTNGLIAKAVEMCAERRIPFLHYGVWSKRGLGDFKKHHGFVCHQVPRYFVPLSLKGQFLLKLNFHKKFVEVIPESWIDRLVFLRGRWNSFKYAVSGRNGAVAQLAERRS